ncbi:hypothetical protein GCM10009617_35290 [Leifsonia poae]|uniref:Uncharacterized protein n=1 Tax=Leifsonia poae TaxID=110933 RepID=A0A9W6LZ51_9MICO|nr:hypothetical protein GCM10017584_14570 [Leifsonia poae]
MIRISAGALALAAVVALTACSSERVGSTADEPPVTAAPLVAGSIVDALAPSQSAVVQTMSPPMKADVLDATTASGLLSMPWVLVSLSADHRVAEIVAVTGNGSCVVPVGVRVQRSPGAVTLAALSRKGPDQSCDARLDFERLTVELPVAVGGDVRLIHPPTDPDWSNPAFLAGLT